MLTVQEAYAALDQIRIYVLSDCLYRVAVIANRVGPRILLQKVWDRQKVPVELMW